MVVFLVTRIARDALRTAIEESGVNDTVLVAAGAHGVSDNQCDILEPLIIRIDPTSNGTDGLQPLAHKPLDSVL